MLQHIISNKVEKSKQNVEAYLTSSGSQPQQPQQSVISGSRPSAQPNPQPTSSASLNKSKLNKNEIDVKFMNVAGKQFRKEGMVFRMIKEESKFEFVYEEDGVKTKLEGKRDSLIGKRVRPNYADGSCTFEIKQAMFKREDVKESSQKGTSVWTNGKQVNEQTVLILLKDKEQLKPLLESPFLEGIIDLNLNGVGYIEQPKNIQIPPVVTEDAEMEEDHGHIKLSLPTAAQQPETDRIRKIIKQMKQEEKNTVLFEIFKIKKVYDDPNILKKMKCPIHFCEKSYKDLQQLKSHLKTKHPELSKHGIQMSEYDGTFQYGNKAIDLALFIGKMFPQQMKKIVKQMKTKNSQ